jgi:hypothetical protein
VPKQTRCGLSIERARVLRGLRTDQALKQRNRTVQAEVTNAPDVDDAGVGSGLPELATEAQCRGVMTKGWAKSRRRTLSSITTLRSLLNILKP